MQISDPSSTKRSSHNLCRTIPCPRLPHLTQAWTHEAVSLLPTQSPGYPSSTLGSDSRQGCPFAYIHMPCLATPNGFRTDLLSHKKREGKERVGTGKGQYVLIQSANQRELGQTQAMWWSQLCFFFFFSSLSSNFLPASVLCPSSFFFLSPTLHQEYQC